MSTSAFHIPKIFFKDSILFSLIILSMLVMCVGIWMDFLWIAAFLPAIIIIFYLTLFQIKWLFRILVFSIPLSFEMALPGGLSTDFPGEPILWVLFIATAFLIFKNGLPRIAFTRLSLVIFLHLSWVLVASIIAVDPVVAFKYTMAKMWYILPFYILPFYIVSSLDEVRILFKSFILGLFVAAVYFFIQHWQLDLLYASRTIAGQPIWRNHVNYACTLVISLPMIWHLFRTSKSPDRWLYMLVGGLFFLFIYFAFARIAYLCMISSLVYVVILKVKWTRIALVVSLVVCICSISWFMSNDRYLNLAPRYDKTITQLDFESKLTATARGEDISTMERLHRWVAGSQMIKERPWFGFGPANFYKSYVPYTVYSFETYVSYNPERSGIHNYFLMVLVEQGYIGLSLFLLILFIALISLETKYHLANDSEYKDLLHATGSILIMIITINIVNDMIEVIKIGGIFFFILNISQRKLLKS